MKQSDEGKWRYLARGLSLAQLREPLLLPVELGRTLVRLHHSLYVKCREKAEQEANPAACIIDSGTREER